MTIETTPPTPPETAAAVSPRTKRKASRMRRKRGRLARMTAADRARYAARNRFYAWDEAYTEALKAIIASLTTGRRLTAAQVVKMA